MSEFHYVIFNMAANQLASQKEDLKNLRNQAAISSAVSGIITTVFATIAPPGAILLTKGEVGLWGVPVMVGFVVILFALSIGCSILAMTDQEDCCFEFEAVWAHNEYAKLRDEKNVLRVMAEAADGFHVDNEKVID